MPASRQSRFKDRYDKLLDDSLAIVQDRDFSVEELAQTAEDTYKRIPGAVLVPIERLAPNEDNPRQTIKEHALTDLAESIAERGLLQPLVVRRAAERPGYYVVIAGSRRLLAARLIHGDPAEEVRARVALIPCIIKEESAQDAFADALLENLARADLSRAEMMEALLRLNRDYGWSSHVIARRTGRNQSDIAQLLGVARHPDLAQLVRQEIIKPTVASEINRLPVAMREATIADVRAGTVRTVADVKRRRALVQSGPHTPRDITDRVISLTPQVGELTVESASRVSDITHPPAAARSGGAAESAFVRPDGAAAEDLSDASGQVASSATHQVISLTPTGPALSLREHLDAVGALVGMVDAATPAGATILDAVGKDLAAAYEKLVAYLTRHGAAAE